MWHSIEIKSCSSSGQMHSEIIVKADSPWFSGHFPGEPVLPGIAQLSMVMETIRLSTNGRVRLSGLKRIRFRQVIRPESLLQVVITPKTDNDGLSYSFKIIIGNDIACSGILLAETSPRIIEASKGERR